MGSRIRAVPGRVRSALAVVATAALAVAGCGSGDEDAVPVATTRPLLTTSATTAPATTPVATTPATTAPATTTPGSAAVTSTSGTGAGTTPTSSAGDVLAQDDIDAITSVFATFFGGNQSTLDDKVAALEHGETFRAMLDAAGANEQFQQMSTDIREVRAGSDAECAALGAGNGCAIVVHDVLVSGFPMAAGITSPAIRHDGSWLVGSMAWCNLVAIGGETCPEVPNGSTP